MLDIRRISTNRWWHKKKNWLFFIFLLFLVFVRITKGSLYKDIYYFISRPFWPGQFQREIIADSVNKEQLIKLKQIEIDNNRLREILSLQRQSGSDKMLKSMKRRYTTSLYINKLNKIKSFDQDACIGVDVIVGYPTESDEDFLETYNFLKSNDVSYLHVFTYSEREDTEAIGIRPVVPRSERSRRSKILHELSDQKKSAFYEKSIGKTKPVLVEKNKNGMLFGYTDNYIKTRIQGPVSLENTIQNVLISDFKKSYVECEVLTTN